MEPEYDDEFHVDQSEVDDAFIEMVEWDVIMTEVEWAIHEASWTPEGEPR